MMSKLKAAYVRGKHTALLLLLTMFVMALSLNSYVYDDICVAINIDGVTVKQVTGPADVVANILSRENIVVSKSDSISPELDVKLFEDAVISIKRLKNVTVQNGDVTYPVKTLASTTEELALSLPGGMTPADGLIDASLGASGAVKNGGTYEVIPAYEINVYADGCRYPVQAAYGTVADALRLSGVVTTLEDIVTPAMTEALYPGIEIYVTRVVTVRSTETIDLEFDTEYRINRYLSPGEEVVTVEGSMGQVLQETVIVFHDGEAVSYDCQELSAVPAVNRVIECGVWNVKNLPLAQTVAGVIDGYAYSKVITANATAYCDQGRTASGIHSKEGVVAVDPRVIPLGTRLYIESTDGSWSYGVCLAGDTGGAIKGNRVDLFYDSYSQCVQFGRRSCNIYVLCD